MLTVIPVEIVLAILSYIPLPQLHHLQRVSHEWLIFFVENESSIYHAAAILHDFATSRASLLECKAFHVSWLADVHTWRQLCKKYCAMERRWEANGTPRYGCVGAAGETVHRFKVDTEQRTVISTYMNGGLRVTGIDEDEVLWSLPRSTVQRWAHCEYDGGFLVFTRMDAAMEVWRRKRDARIDTSCPFSLEPGPDQQNANQLSFQSLQSISQDDRGAFVPWTLIVPPNSVRASRLVFPNLLIASPSAQEAYVYDVVTGKLTQSIPLGYPQDPPINIKYVELGARHIFVCTDNDVLVISREEKTSMKFPSQVDNFDGLYAERTYRPSQSIGDSVLRDFTQDALPKLEESPLESPTSYHSVIQPRVRRFTAVHVSPCGSHFVAADIMGCLYLVRNFEQAIRGTIPLSHCVTIVDFMHSITYLALDDTRRVCIHVRGLGIFIVSFLPGMTTSEVQPQVSYPRLLRARSLGMYDLSPCVQLTRTELWTKKDTDAGMNVLCYLDFTQSQ